MKSYPFLAQIDTTAEQMDQKYSYANVSMDGQKPPQEDMILENMRKFDETMYDTTTQ